MPTFDYKCNNCDHIFEKFKRLSEDLDLEKCPKCKSETKRMVSCGTGIIFKGTGFYATDYKKKS